MHVMYVRIHLFCHVCTVACMVSLGREYRQFSHHYMILYFICPNAHMYVHLYTWFCKLACLSYSRTTTNNIQVAFRPKLEYATQLDYKQLNKQYIKQSIDYTIDYFSQLVGGVAIQAAGCFGRVDRISQLWSIFSSKIKDDTIYYPYAIYQESYITPYI